MLNLVLLLSQFAVFANCVIYCFVSLITSAYYQFLLWYDWSLWYYFCVVIKRDSVTLFRLPFLCHIHVILDTIPWVCCLKYLHNCFSFHFCFLNVFIVPLLFVPKLISVAVTDLAFFVFLVHRAIGWMSRVFANGLGYRGSIPGRVIPKTLKMVFDATLLSTQNYKVRITSKVEQSREGVASFLTPRCSSYWKGSLWVALD